MVEALGRSRHLRERDRIMMTRITVKKSDGDLEVWSRLLVH